MSEYWLLLVFVKNNAAKTPAMMYVSRKTFNIMSRRKIRFPSNSNERDDLGAEPPPYRHPSVECATVLKVGQRGAGFPSGITTKNGSRS